jgi:hypothetical protein
MRQKENLSKEPLKAEPLDYRAQIKEDWAQLRKKLKNDYFEKTFDFDIGVLFDGKNFDKAPENKGQEYKKDMELAESIIDSLADKRKEYILLSVKKKLWAKDTEAAILKIWGEIDELDIKLSVLVDKYPKSPEMKFFSMVSNYWFDNKKFVIWIRELIEISDKYKYEIYVFFKNFIIEIWKDWVKKRWEQWFELQELVFSSFKTELKKIIESKLKDSWYPKDIEENFKWALDLLK